MGRVGGGVNSHGHKCTKKTKDYNSSKRDELARLC